MDEAETCRVDIDVEGGEDSDLSKDTFVVVVDEGEFLRAVLGRMEEERLLV